jgi:adenosyl cobinamide kinase/adenosyl cobinamide phosphate guanylyltransferase
MSNNIYTGYNATYTLIDDLDDVLTNTLSTYHKNLEEAIKDKIAETTTQLESLNKCLEIIKSLKYKPGEIVVHREHGNGLVLCPYIKELSDYNGISYKDLLEKFENELAYVVHFVKKSKDSISVVKEIVKEEELMPYTTSSKVLFGG